MQQSYLDTPVETFPLGVAKIEVQNGHWTFNNKPLKNCKFPIQRLVETFIKANAFRMEIQNESITRSYSVIATKETVWAGSKLKAYNYVFPPTKEEIAAKEAARKEKAIGVSYLPEMEIFPEFIPKHKTN